MSSTDDGSRPTAGADPGHPSGHVHQGHDGRALVIAWISVTLMIIGFGLCTLGLPVQSARLALFISGGVIGVIGVALGAAGGIMNNVE